MSIAINKIADVDKLLAFLRVGAKGKFTVATEMIPELIDRVMNWAKSKNIRVDFTNPDGAKLTAFTAAGCATGLAVGIAFALSTVPLFAASVAGAAVGFAAAHIAIEVSPASHEGTTTVSIA